MDTNRREIVGLSGLHLPLALGFMDFSSFESGAPILDAFVAGGGTILDTAWVYNDGYTEQLCGEWMAARGNRREVTIVGKGAHTPHCTPEAIGRQLTESLDRLGTDHVDVYLMHRDNPEVPVGEFVDAMDAEVRAGRINGSFGGSNWSMERMDEAIAYAQSNNKHAPNVLSNNFSLAEMVGTIWDGCVSSSTAEWQSWLAARGVTNFAWSSQGRGFFTDRAGRDKLDDEEIVRVWYSEKNFARRDRAVELANQLGVAPIQIALAYVASHPTSQVAVIGPHTISELNASIAAFDIALSAQQLAWLAGEDE
jgi:aryl-alcohol dehydrogenase-like predicted oxidoreductase